MRREEAPESAGPGDWKARLASSDDWRLDAPALFLVEDFAGDLEAALFGDFGEAFGVFVLGEAFGAGDFDARLLFLAAGAGAGAGAGAAAAGAAGAGVAFFRMDTTTAMMTLETAAMASAARISGLIDTM